MSAAPATGVATGATTVSTSVQRLPSCWPSAISGAFQASDPAAVTAT